MLIRLVSLRSTVGYRDTEIRNIDFKRNTLSKIDNSLISMDTTKASR